MTASSSSVKVNRLDFHRRADGAVVLSAFQLARPRAESIAAPTPAELAAWAGYAAATVFLARKGGVENDGMAPAGLTTLAHLKRIPAGQLVEGGEPPAADGARVACVLVWDKPGGRVGVDVLGSEEGWEHTPAGRTAQAVAALMSA